MAFKDQMKDLLEKGGQATKDLMEKSGQATKNFAEKAGSKVQELGEIGVLKVEIQQFEAQKNKLLNRLGAETYALLSAVNVSASPDAAGTESAAASATAAAEGSEATSGSAVSSITRDTPAIQALINDLDKVSAEIKKREAELTAHSSK